MYSKWITKITPDNLDFVVEYCTRYRRLSREEITNQMQLNANFGEESYLLVYNPENPTGTEIYIVGEREVQERYFLIPVYHPEGHLQEFVVND